MIEALRPHAYVPCTETHLFNGTGPHCHWDDLPQSDPVHLCNDEIGCREPLPCPTHGMPGVA